MILLFEVTLTFNAPVKAPLRTTTAAPSACTAAVNCANVETVVVVPPVPPVVLSRRQPRQEFCIIRKKPPEVVLTYPPFIVQYPTVQASVMVARFSIVRPSRGPFSVGVGVALATPAKRAGARRASLMMARDEITSGSTIFR